MLETKIEWTDSTFNPWWGCEHVSPGCDHCYAEAQAKRYGHKWSDRRMFGINHWREPLKWNAQAATLKKRRKVFCASFADVFEDRPQLKLERTRLWALILLTPWLDWLLLTKRPQNIRRLLPTPADYVGMNYEARDLLDRDHVYVAGVYRPGLFYTGTETIARPPPNVWLGMTAENQKWFDYRRKHLLNVPATVHFVSIEPQLGPIDARLAEHHDGRGIDWIICGGESGHGARAFDLEWARDLADQCTVAGVPFFMKQLGKNPVDDDAQLDLKDTKGGNLIEWREKKLAVPMRREFPKVRDAA